MFRTAIWFACCLFLSFVLVACSRPENKLPVGPAASSSDAPKALPTEGPPADVVTVSVPQVELNANRDAEASLSVKIADGYHINGNPASKYQIATALEMEKADGITAGKPVYPQAILKKFSFSSEPILVYESGTVIKQPLRAGAGAAKGNQTMHAKLKVQPCDDTVCYPPRNLEVTIPVNVN